MLIIWEMTKFRKWLIDKKELGFNEKKKNMWYALSVLFYRRGRITLTED